jgi:hypothetical protein
VSDILECTIGTFLLQIQQVIKSKGSAGQAKLKGIEIESVKVLINFLEPFAVHTDKLQGQHYPSLPYAALSFDRLLDHCSPNVDDSEELAMVREKAYGLLCEKILIKREHQIATFLWPRCKHLPICSTEFEKKEVIYIFNGPF